MSRPLRIEYPGAWYHVMNRGRRREDIFLSQHDFQEFIQILQEAAETWNLKIAAYCLMSNHYHLLVHTPDGNLSRCMRHVNGVYTQRFNRYHGEDGQLFRGRYKAVLIEADSHLLEVLRYIHQNPLEAGISSTLKDYEWTSHHGYISWANKWNWLYKETLLTMLSAKKSKRRASYIDFVSADIPEEIERFYGLKNLSSILGTDSFKEWVSDTFRQAKSHHEIPESRILTTSPEKIIELVCTHFNMDTEQLLASRRGTTNSPRDIAIYLVRLHCKETLQDIGRYFLIHNYSTVSSAVERIKARKNHDRFIKKHLKELKNKLTKSQKKI